MSGMELNLDDILEDLDKVAPSGGGNYHVPGEFIIEIGDVQIKKGHKGITFVGEGRIAHIFKCSVDGIEVGEMRNCVENLSAIGDKKNIGQANMKAYLLAGCESLYQQKIQHKNVNGAFVAKVIRDQTLKGVLVRLDAFQKDKSKSAGTFTMKNWSMVTVAEAERLGLTQKVAA